MREILIATKNSGKAKEFKTFFSKYDIEVKSLLDLEKPVEDIEETGSTFEENAAIKAEEISNLFQIPVLSDDSGLEIDALEGRPGIYSARYAGEPKDDRKNYEKVLEELKDTPEEERSARFVCVLAIANRGKETVFHKGYCEGKIAYEPKGGNGFGYDPVFVPKGYDQTMAQLSPEEKNQISHRRNALVQLEDWLKDNQ